MISLNEKYTEDIEFFNESIIITGKFACMTLSTLTEASAEPIPHIKVLTDIPPYELKSGWNIFLRKVRKNITEFSVEYIPTEKLNRLTETRIKKTEQHIESFIKSGIIILGSEKLLNLYKAAFFFRKNKENSSENKRRKKHNQELSPSGKNRFPGTESYIYIPSTPNLNMLSPFIPFFNVKKQKKFQNGVYNVNGLLPYALLLDPAFTINTSVKVIVDYAIKALGEAIYFFMITDKKQPEYIKRWALHTIEIITTQLPEFTKNQTDHDIRERLLIASAFTSMLIYHYKDNTPHFDIKKHSCSMKEADKIPLIFERICKEYIKSSKSRMQKERILYLQEKMFEN